MRFRTIQENPIFCHKCGDLGALAQETPGRFDACDQCPKGEFRYKERGLYQGIGSSRELISEAIDMYRVIVEGGLTGHFMREGYADTLDEALALKKRFEQQTKKRGTVQKIKGCSYIDAPAEGIS